ncbi:PAS domain-containing protein [Haloarcula sp. Atlit-47R]|uniref:sensor histidine kinase n=1 Tax=Haloarcula sp. Atlit-47R TaxID=2282132 RepID=UPI000EF19A9B|nr:histidine kinase N-terminal 7TM domain-containing protein [Haloarcula sp. Atlit-47R]RLM47635.1 PAS domain-containing protein [Haloarcula sp. Atlit-47R]
MRLTPVLLVAAVLSGGGLAGLGIGYFARRHRDHPASHALSMMAIPPGLAGLCAAGTVVAPRSPISGVLLAASAGLLFLAPAYFLLFTLVYTGHGAVLTRRRRRALVAVYAVVGGVAVLETVTFSGIPVRTVNGLTLPVVASQGPSAIWPLLFAYPPILVSLGLLARFLISSRNIFRRQTAVILLAVLVTLVGNIAFQAGFSPHPGLNLTSVFFSVEAGLIALALFRYDFLSVEPLAPDIVLEEMDDPVMILDESARLIDANPAGLRLLDGESPVGTPIRRVLPGSLDAVRDGEEHVLEDGTVSTDGGEAKMYDLNKTPIRDQYDREQGYVLVLRDITLQKQRERTLASLQSVSQRFLSAETPEEVLEIAVNTVDELLEYPYAGTMMYDEGANALQSAVFTDALADAYRRGDVPENPVVEPGDSDVWQVFESGEPRCGAPIEASDTQLPVDIGGSLLYPLGDHGVLGISAGPDHDGFTEDDCRFADTLATTTENALDRVEKERALRESRELLEMRSEQLRFFNSALRHDLLNGLMVVQGHVDRLDGLVEGEAADRVATIDEWTDDLARMAQEVRSVTRTVAGEDDSDLGAVDLESILAEKAAKFRQGHDNLTVTVKTDSLPAVRADNLLGSVVENLFQNAVEHNDSEAPTVTASASVDSGAVTLRIADNGPGIDDDQKTAIFEEAVTSESSGSVGFGLYFVRVMLDRYGGDVWFEDRADGNRGAVAVVELPTADEAA